MQRWKMFTSKNTEIDALDIGNRVEISLVYNARNNNSTETGNYNSCVYYYTENRVIRESAVYKHYFL